LFDISQKNEFKGDRRSSFFGGHLNLDCGSSANSYYPLTGLNAGTTYGFRLCSYKPLSLTSVGITRLATTTGSVAGWNQEAYIKAFNSEAGDFFGRSVSISGDRIAVGADGEDNVAQTIITSSTPDPNDGIDNSATDSGAVYTFTRTANTWVPEAYIKSVNSDIGDRFGYSLSLSGDYLAVAAIEEDSVQAAITNSALASSDNTNEKSGAVYLYHWDGSTWVQEAYLKASNSDIGDQFGENLILSGNTLVVGVPNEASNATTITQGSRASGDNTNTQSGAVYVFTKDNKGDWIEQAYIKAVNSDALYRFGESISFSGDTLAVGSSGEASNTTTITDGRDMSTDQSNPDSGATYIYQRTNGVWKLQSYIKASNSGTNDLFGGSVALSGDVLAVGAIEEDSDLTTITDAAGLPASINNDITGSGAVYIYKRFRSEWSEEAYIKTDNANANDYFGYKISLSGDTLVASTIEEDSNQITITNGATSSTDNTSPSSGAVYVFKRVAEAWSQVAYIKPPVSTPVHYGQSLEIAGDTIIVGSCKEASNATTITNGTTASSDVSSVASGAVYVYRNHNVLFDPPHVQVERPDSNTLRLSWDKAGTMAASYAIAVSAGETAPADCLTGENNFTTALLTYDVGSLTEDTNYTLRICSVDGASNLSSGVTMTVRTSP
jgi:hypothetical protein